uniref:50S ribosomal protein L9 n=1 Tax=Analipus japonicus TaxID=31333 RepID=UPI002E7A48F8|nr:50S ribosomal protein L9 [Analipus japonicus]WAM61995.1 50S ribosomal protein L9 [Analipus japonicus]
MIKKKTIQAILTKDVEKLGKQGTIIKAKPGYIRNYLIPLKFGKLATPNLITQFNTKQQESELKQRQILDKSMNSKKLLESLDKFTITKKISKNGIFFGKITKKQILDLIKNKIDLPIEINKNQLELPTMNELGNYIINIVLATNITAKVNVEILSE